jgi:hypothetical protein
MEYPYEVIVLFFDPDKNRFINEGGYVVHNVLEYITPNDLYLFRRLKRHMIVRHRSESGILCELFYPDMDDEED